MELEPTQVQDRRPARAFGDNSESQFFNRLLLERLGTKKYYYYFIVIIIIGKCHSSYDTLGGETSGLKQNCLFSSSG